MTPAWLVVLGLAVVVVLLGVALLVWAMARAVSEPAARVEVGPASGDQRRVHVAPGPRRQENVAPGPVYFWPGLTEAEHRARLVEMGW